MPRKPSLYFAFVKPVGADIGPACACLRETLALAGYGTAEIRLSSLLCETSVARRYEINSESAVERINARMSAGDALRTFWRPDAIARLGVREAVAIATAESDNNSALLASRAEGGTYDRSQDGFAAVFLSLMHPSEVELLRSLYGERLFVISAFSSRARRLEGLADQLVAAGGHEDDGKARIEAIAAAEDLLRRERGIGFRNMDDLQARRAKLERLNVEKTFPLADLFIDIDTEATLLNSEIRRFVRLIFGDPFGISRPDEVGMALAFAAADQSACLARRVGASVVRDGFPLAIGRNDLPVARGGQLTVATATDDANVRKLPDASNEEREDVFSDALQALFQVTDWDEEPTGRFRLESLEKEEDFDSLVKWLLMQLPVQKARIFDLIEFNPTVHAEMSAITGAAREGISLQSATLFTTTFPCHECTRHIVSTGIDRVVYLEPYVKSRAEDLFEGQIVLTAAGEELEGDERVRFSPFMGIAPRRHGVLFSWIERKDSSGRARPFELRKTKGIRPSIWPTTTTDDQCDEIERSLMAQQQLVAEEIDEQIGSAAEILGGNPADGPTNDSQ